jgi:hypothetical protein
MAVLLAVLLWMSLHLNPRERFPVSTVPEAGQQR